jgi:hypothetical protein
MNCDDARANPATLANRGSGTPVVTWRGTGTESADHTPQFFIGPAEEGVAFHHLDDTESSGR